MSEADLQLWEFEEAPPDLQRLIPAAFSGGWLALIPAGKSAHVARVFTEWWQSAGLPLAQRDAGAGRVVLAGPHRKRRKNGRVAGAS